MESLTNYRLLAQVGAGRDGVAYRAQAVDDGSPVEVRMLLGVRDDAERWPALVKRLRIAALLAYPAAQRVCELNLEHEPPFVVMEWVEGRSMAEELRSELPVPQPRALVLARTVAAALAAAHQLGLAHGRVGPSRLRLLNGTNMKTDFTGLDVSPAVEIDALCQAPEFTTTAMARPAMDVYSLGALLCWMLTGEGPSTSPQQGQCSPHAPREEILTRSVRTTFAGEDRRITELLQAMLSAAPTDRPSIQEVESQLAAFHAENDVTREYVETVAAHEAVTMVACSDQPLPVPSDEILARKKLGRFRVLSKLGEGGMGAVYRAEDSADGSHVALKVLRAELAQKPRALKRFHKEARLLKEIQSPYVTNYLEVNEDNGIHYLALELVEGQPLKKLLHEQGALPEKLVLTIMADVARALADAHARGIVHRDIKPENILVVSGGVVSGEVVNDESSDDIPARSSFTTHHSPLIVKLTDFGLARHLVESESLQLTQAGAFLGTPLYMAPEQCSGDGIVDARSDVYAMGVTLFHLLAGQPPFRASTTAAVMAMHCNEPPPALKKLKPDLSDGVCHVVEKCLAKAPATRYADAGALLEELERMLRGEPTSIVVHPRLPPCDPAHVLQYDWTWSLESSPVQLWPHVSNTERLNRAAGLSAVQFTSDRDESGAVRRFGGFHRAGITVQWQEHPYEWVEGRKMGVLREYSQGPFQWMISMVELAPRTGGGTLLTHRVRIEPRGLIGRTVAAVEAGIRGRRGLDRVYRRIDAALTGKLGEQGLADPFEEPAHLTTVQRQQLDNVLDRLNARGVEPLVVERLGDYLSVAPPQEAARIRPLALARRLALDPEQLVAACLHGAREGLLVLLWDILCPVCRIPSEVKDTLKALREHGRCEACHLDFELDFANSVEMIFRVHPQVRDTELGVYCIGGPVHSPHVAAQVRVGPGERIELELSLAEGAYRLRGPQLPFTLDFYVRPAAGTCRWDLSLSRGPGPDWPRTMQAGHQLIVLTNDLDRELVARVERTAPREDALTAARATALALFRELFPTEVLAPGQLVSVANVTLLVTALAEADDLYQAWGDARAFGAIHEHFRLLNERIRREGGALVKTVGESVVAAFHEPVAAVRAASDFPEILAAHEPTKSLRLRMGIHRGSAMAATLNDHLDYFGSTVNAAMQLPQFAGAGELVLTQAVAADPQVAAFLATRNYVSEVLSATLPGRQGEWLQRVRQTGPVSW